MNCPHARSELEEVFKAAAETTLSNLRVKTL